MKKAKKTLALVLALVMCMSLIPTVALADTGAKEDYKVISIGASDSNGYCLDDYSVYSEATWAVGYHDSGLGFMDYASRYSTGYLMADYLTKTLTDKNVVFESLTFEGMRTDELRALLDKNYKGDYFCYPDHMPHYEEMFAGDPDEGFAGYAASHDVGEAKDVHEFFVQEITDADLIIMDCCTNNFGTYISDRLMGYHGGALDETVYDALDSIAPGFKETAEYTINKYFSFLKDIVPEGIAQDLIDSITYAFVDMCVNFSVDVDTILKLNPNAKLICVGPANIMQGLTAEYNGITLDIGAIWGVMINLANTYITTLDPNRNKFYYANVMEGVELIIEDVAKGEFTNIYNDDLVDYFGELTQEDIDLVVKAAGHTCVDISAILDVISSDLKNSAKAAMAKGVAEGWDALSSAEQSLLYVYLRFFINGSGTHPSADGYVAKFNAVKAAYNSKIAASGKCIEVLAETGRQAAVGVTTTITAPIVNAVKKNLSIDLTTSVKDAINILSKSLVKRIF